jgi:hypothetical protein
VIPGLCSVFNDAGALKFRHGYANNLLRGQRTLSRISKAAVPDATLMQAVHNVFYISRPPLLIDGDWGRRPCLTTWRYAGTGT